MYKFPFQLFIILEKLPVTFFTSDAVTSNHYIFFIPKNWKHSVLATLKYELTTNLLYLVESTVVDTYNYDIFTKKHEYNLELSRLLRFDNYYSMYSRTRFTIIESSTTKPLVSSAFFFKNAIWLEREIMEMYGPIFNTIYDTRNLMLEYSFTEHPLLKTYPSEGYVDMYYDVFRDQLCYVNHDYVEL